MQISNIIDHINKKRSFLCVGLDSDIDRLPKEFDRTLKSLISFNEEIIEATKEHCVAYKINTAFYERYGSKGWKALEKTRKLLPDSHFLIADAKRGDIGNTSRQYALAFFDHLDFDAITLSPYMGRDSIQPFLEFDNKWAILLSVTSNPGSADFQRMRNPEGQELFEKVIEKSTLWAGPDKIMFVCGATQSERLLLARKAAPNYFFLVPGVGAQGGSLEEVYSLSSTRSTGLLVNSSRSIIYASSGPDFREAAAAKAADLAGRMSLLLP